jgi:hypothetical protein
MNDRLHQVDLRMSREGRKGWPNRRCTGNLAVLLWNIAASPVAPASRNDNSRDHSHEATLRSLLLPLYRMFKACGNAAVDPGRAVPLPFRQERPASLTLFEPPGPLFTGYQYCSAALAPHGILAKLYAEAEPRLIRVHMSGRLDHESPLFRKLEHKIPAESQLFQPLRGAIDKSGRGWP